MITLFTGLPGNAKTLKVLQWLQKKALAENRDVYYSGVNECRVPSQIRSDGTMSKPWVEIDPKEWMAVPDGALIFIDEAQDTFEKKNSGASLPEYYKMLAKHRHTGKDIVLATQHPSLIDNFVRKLVQQHFHAIRKFGLNRSTYYEWDKVSDQPEKAASHKNAVSTEKFSYPKEIYNWYTSASQHTVKRRVPLKLVLAALLVAVLAGYALFMMNRMLHKNDATKNAAVSSENGSGNQKTNGDLKNIKAFDEIADAKQYVAMSTPRIVGLPHTAPKYDELTKPTHVPVPAMCIQKKTTCKCFTQQASPMDVAFNMCVEFARNGYFQDFDADKDRVADARTQRGADVVANSPVGRSVGSLETSSGVSVIPNLEPVAASKPAAPVDNGAGKRPGAGSGAAGAPTSPPV